LLDKVISGVVLCFCCFGVCKVILVQVPPNLIPYPACPTTPVKVFGWRNHTLRIASYDMLTGRLIGEYTRSITSDPYEDHIGWATPGSRALILAVLEVLDSSGNVKERWSQPFIYIPGATLVRLPEKSTVAYVAKVGGVTKIVDSTDEVWLDPLVMVVVRRKGYLCIYDGTRKVVEVQGKSAVFELVFDVPLDVARMFANYIDNSNVAMVVYKEPSLADYIGALTYVKHVSEQLRFTNVGTTVARYQNYIRVKCRFHTDLYSSFNWLRILNVLAGVAAVAAGVALLVVSGGLSTPISYSTIIAGIAIATGTATVLANTLTAEPTVILPGVRQVVETAKEEIEMYKSELYRYLEQLKSAGKLTDEEVSAVKGYVESIVATAYETFEELEKLINAAYNKGRSEMIPWIVVAGVGGLAVGYMVGTRAG